MKRISTTIKSEHMKRILNGTKIIEYKGDTIFWHTRLSKLDNLFDEFIIINFLCGRQSYKYHVIGVTWFFGFEGIIIDYMFYYSWWEIFLGPRLL